MRSFVAYDIAVLTVIFTLNIISPVKGQCTVKGCESGDSAGSIAAEIQDLLMEVHERLQAIDRRSQEQDIYIRKVQGVDERLNSINESLHQLKDQQDTFVTSLQAVDRRSQEQHIYIKQVQSMHELLNESFQQMTNQHTTVLIRLEEIKELLLDHDISTKNESQSLWKLAIGDPLLQNNVTGSEGDLAQLPSLNNWTVIMKRSDGSLNFNRSWTEYKNGFGDVRRGEFWLGNKEVHRLTNRSGFVYALRVEVQLKANGVWYSANYSTFSIDSENNNYTLRLSGFSGGNAGDSLTNISERSTAYLGGMSFSTSDADNDRSGGNCASSYGGGWWFNNCHDACLTCQYNHYSFKWYSLHHLSSDGWGLLRAARMMIRSK